MEYPAEVQRFSSSQGDILNDENLKWAFKSKPDIVYHLAAHFANQNSVDNPEKDLMVNGIGISKGAPVCPTGECGTVCVFFFGLRGLWS